MMLMRRSTWASVLGCAALASGASAQTAHSSRPLTQDKPDRDGPIELQEIVVTGQRTEEITDADIQRFRGTSPADIFKNTPGVLSGESRNSGAIDPNIRGLQGYGRVTVTVDGAQQNSIVDRGYLGDSNRTFIDPDLISEIDIEKGPSNAPSSSGAIGGAVAIETIGAADILRDGATWGLRVRTGASSNSASPPPEGTVGGIDDDLGSPFTVASNNPSNPAQAVPTAEEFARLAQAEGRPDVFEPTGWNGSLAWAARRGNLELVAALAHRDTGNYFAGEEGGNPARIELLSRETRSFQATAGNIRTWDRRFPGHGLRVGDTITTTTESYDNTGDSQYRAGEEVLNTSSQTTSALAKARLDLGRNGELEAAYMRNDSEFGFFWPSGLKFGRPTQTPLSHAVVDTFTTSYDYRPEDTPLVNLSINAWTTDQDIQEANRTPGSSGITDNESDTRAWGVDVSNTSRLTGFGQNLTLQYGAAYLSQDFAQLGVETYPESPEAGTNRSADAADREQIDLFVSGAWTPVAWLDLGAGVRYIEVDNTYGFRTEIEGLQLVTEGGYGRSDSGFAPQASIAVRPTPGLRFYGQYKEGFRAPSFKEFADFEGFQDIVPSDRVLRPERAKNSEIGVDLTANGLLAESDALAFNVNYFNNEIEDYVEFVFEFTPPTFLLSPVNYEKVSFSGLEVSGRYAIGPVFAEASAIFYDEVEFCRTSAACLTSESEEGLPANSWRNQVPPEISASATVGARLFDDDLTLAARAYYISERIGEPTGYVDPGFTLWDSYTTVDVSASYRLNDRVSLSFTGENVFDRYFVDAIAQAKQPGPGRTLRLALEARF